MPPITREDTSFGPGGYGAGLAAVPGVPTHSTSEQFNIVTGTNDVLKLSYDGGAVTDVTLSQNVYTYTALATEIQTQCDSALGCTSTVTHSSTTGLNDAKFTIDVGSGHTVALTYTGSTAAVTLGFEGDKSAAQSITSDRYVHGAGTITFTIAANGNDDTTEMAIYCITNSKYVSADGDADEASEIWQDFADWDNGGANGTVTIISASGSALVDFTGYTFKVKARNADNTETAFSADSASMTTMPYIDYGSISAPLDREVTTGNTKVMSGTDLPAVADSTDSYGAVKITLKLQNNTSTTSRVALEFSEDGGTSYSSATDMFTITSANDVLNFESDQGGPVDIDVVDGTYDDGDAMATALQTALNANTTLTGSGTITFAVTWSSSTTKYTIDAGAGHWVNYNHFATNVDGGYTFGFTASHTGNDRTITTDEARGDSPRVLSTSAAGTSHDVYWNSYIDAGESELKESLARVQFTPYDASPSGGDAGTAVATAVFTLDNRPQQITLSATDNYSWDKDDTPTIEGVMRSLRGGSRGFFRIKFYDSTDDSLVLLRLSATVQAGWEYEQTSGGGYTAVPAGGVDPQYIGNSQKVRYTVQASDALTQGKTYNIYIEQGEYRDRE